MTPDPDLIARLRAAGPFRELDDAWVRTLALHATRRTLSSGDYVWRHGDSAQYFVIVQRGLVAIQRVTPEGEVVFVALFGSGDTLCIVPAMQHMALPADAIAVSERVEVLLVTAAPVLSAARDHPEIAAVLNRALLQHTSSLRTKIDIVTAGTVPRRVAALLLHLAERFGREIGGGVIEIDPALTREQIGQLVNARTETVIRIMSRWSKAGWIEGTSSSLRLSRIDMLKRIVYGVARPVGAA